MTETEKNAIFNLANQGLNDHQIAKQMHYSRPYVSAILKEMGVIRKRGNPRTVPAETVARMIELRRQGMSYQRIGEHLRMSRYTVYDCIKREEKYEAD